MTHIVFCTEAESVKGQAMRRDSRICLCVDDERPPYAYVMIEGTARLSEDMDEILRLGTVIGGRYMGVDRAEEFGRRNGCAWRFAGPGDADDGDGPGGYRRLISRGGRPLFVE
ncbi:MAG: pyridoxamine 5'-phosphate oxidase family protein [Candidatus Dormibacteraceae bacterium]